MEAPTTDSGDRGEEIPDLLAHGAICGAEVDLHPAHRDDERDEAPQVTAARIGLCHTIRPVASVICPRLTMSMIPPNWTNWLIVSTSEVTCETIEPRLSAFWVNTD
ncbi:MAG: hypothetical protein IPH03_08080 [Tetrasphaera sp.]|nr:hypothetical protein [Tetrasphaera sp.]